MGFAMSGMSIGTITVSFLAIRLKSTMTCLGASYRRSSLRSTWLERALLTVYRLLRSRSCLAARCLRFAERT